MTLYQFSVTSGLKLQSFPIAVAHCYDCGFERILEQCDFCDKFICEQCSEDYQGCGNREGKPHFLDLLS